MGTHYIPQYYLKGFTEPESNSLWTYEKGSGRKFRTQIKNLATITNFYPPHVESSLANETERPANKVIDKIRNRDQIDKDEKKILAEYMAVMWKRVPTAKERLKRMAPDVTQKLSNKYDQELNMIATQEPHNAELIEKRRTEFKEILNRYSKDPPEEVWLETIDPKKTPLMVEAMASMVWTFLTFDDKPNFLTCDNPVFIFSDIGVAKQESELSFPLSSNISLWATWKESSQQDYIRSTTAAAVKEINRRTAANASKYIFSGSNEHWIEPFIKKGRWKLHWMV